MPKLGSIYSPKASDIVVQIFVPVLWKGIAFQLFLHMGSVERLLVLIVSCVSHVPRSSCSRISLSRGSAGFSASSGIARGRPKCSAPGYAAIQQVQMDPPFRYIPLV